MLWAHGLGQSCQGWDGVMHYFEARFRVIAYDARGHGRSQILAHQQDYSQDLMVRDMYGLLDMLGVDKAIVAGHSMGANVALNFALQHPKRCIGVIPVAIGSGSSDPAFWKKYFAKLADLLEQQGTAAYLDEMKKTPSWERALSHPTIGERVTQSELANDPLALARCIRGIQSKRPSIFSLQPTLEALRVPTLIVWSDGDAAVVECSRFLTQCIPDAACAEIPAASHWTHLEASGEFHRILDRFVSELPY